MQSTASTFSSKHSARTLLTASCALALVAVALSGVLPHTVPAARAVPEPAIVSDAWQLDFTQSLPRRITVEVPGTNVPRAYWYVTYVAINNTGTEQMFLPVIEVVDKNGSVLLANKGVSPRVFDRIVEQERGKPLVAPLAVSGPILQGEDQAKYGVAIWEETDSRPGTFFVFVAGLSGEILTLVDSGGKPVTDADGKAIKLRKTRSLEFTVRGDELYAGDPVTAGSATWVMR